MLPAETANLLGIGAVLGKEFELRTVAHLADLNSDAASERLAEAQRRHFVWIQQDTGRCLFVHDKIRMALLSRLEVEHRRGIHRRAANYFRRVAPENVFDLAYHFDAAGESECALPFALEAAERARKQHSLEVAEQQYQIASRGLESASDAMQFSAAEGLGEVLMLRGRYDKAELCLKAAVGLASGRQQRARITGKLGELALKRGQVEEATQSFEAALRLLGFVVPRRVWAFALWLVGEVFVQLLHSLFPRMLVHRRRRGASQATALGLRFFSRLCMATGSRAAKSTCCGRTCED